MFELKSRYTAVYANIQLQSFFLLIVLIRIQSSNIAQKNSNVCK